MCVRVRAETQSIQEMKIVFIHDFGVNLPYCITFYTLHITVHYKCYIFAIKKKPREKISRIATVQWMTLYTQLTVYDAINMDIHCATPQSHKYKQTKRKARIFRLRRPGIFNSLFYTHCLQNIL